MVIDKKEPPSMEVGIRRAGPDEARVLTDIAHESKRHWSYPERWIEEWRDALTIAPASMARCPTYVAVSGTMAVGFYVVMVEGDDAFLEHLWLRPEWIGRGVGRLLFEHAVRTAAALGARQLQIVADPNAESFYMHMGAHRVGEVPAQVDDIPRVLPRLVLDLPQTAK
jgi:GNAT superfamily N-acetyltransferase